MFYFSVAFLIKVFSLQQTWIQQIQFIFSYNTTTSLCESHREFHYSTVTASIPILSCADLFIGSLFKLWKSYKVIQIMEYKLYVFKIWDTHLFKSWNTKIVTQIMGYFKNHGMYNQNNVHLYIYQWELSLHSKYLLSTPKPQSYGESLSPTDIRSSAFNG